MHHARRLSLYESPATKDICHLLGLWLIAMFFPLAARAQAPAVWTAADAPPPASWTKSATIEINAPDHRPDGKTWDTEVPVMIGPVMPNAGNPAPDMMLCILDASGHDHCIHESRVNKFGVPYSICPDVYRCDFGNVKLPASGSFGVLVVDLDYLPSSQDYMLAAILHVGGADRSDNFKLERALKALIMHWHVVGAPDEFEDEKMASCTLADPCFGSSKGGIPSLSFSETAIGSCAEIGLNMSGTMSFDAGERAHEVDFRFRSSENECPGKTEYVWQFGDGFTLTTEGPAARHLYQSSGTFSAKVAPRCMRSKSVCDAPPALTEIQIAP